MLSKEDFFNIISRNNKVKDARILYYEEISSLREYLDKKNLFMMPAWINNKCYYRIFNELRVTFGVLELDEDVLKVFVEDKEDTFIFEIKKVKEKYIKDLTFEKRDYSESLENVQKTINVNEVLNEQGRVEKQKVEIIFSNRANELLPDKISYDSEITEKTDSLSVKVNSKTEFADSNKSYFSVAKRKFAKKEDSVLLPKIKFKHDRFEGMTLNVEEYVTSNLCHKDLGHLNTEVYDVEKGE